MNEEKNRTIKIRAGSVSDVPALAELEKVIFPQEAWSEEMFRGEFSELNETVYLLLVDTAADGEPKAAEGKIIGYAGIWIIQDEGHITNVGVRHEYRRRGLAETLVKALLAEAESRGVLRETLEVRVSNAPAITLYEKLGFKLVGKRRGYYADNHEDALIYWREKEN